jgi:hypothetical protein
MTVQMSQNDTNQMAASLPPIPPSMSLTLIDTTGAASTHSGLKAGTNRSFRTNSGFVAHLLAVRHDAPDMRLKRRATPAQAVHAYGLASQPRDDSKSAVFTFAA